MRAKYIDKKLLRKLYIDEKKSGIQIATLLNISRETIYKKLKKNNIDIRSVGEREHIRKANHCNLSHKAIEWINGEMLGDGSLRAQSKYSAHFAYSSKFEEYINYISDTLNSFGINRSGNIRSRRDKKFKNSIAYHYASLRYTELHTLYKKWYPNGRKIVPKDIELSPIALRQFYIGDGSLGNIQNKYSYIELCTNGFPPEDVEFLVKKLKDIGFKTTRQPRNNVIRISTYSTKDFLDYIGKCPVECYQYKWQPRRMRI